jgi:enoyl-CoA hydratase/carnithine racemase
MGEAVGRIRSEIIDDSITVITIDNEGKRNAFSGDMVKQLGRCFDNAEKRTSVRCVVITGAGDRAFSSGHDIGQMHQNPDETADQQLNAAFLRPLEMRKPVIAAVNGAAYAAGLIIALSCDLRVVARHAVLCASGARLGLLPIGGQLSRLPMLMPPGRAMEMLMTAEPMTAQDALSVGFANRVTPEGQALPVALEMARSIARNSPTIVRYIKQGVQQALLQGVAAAREFEWDTAAKLLRDNPDAEEGMRAFLDKRAPQFLDVAGPGTES